MTNRLISQKHFRMFLGQVLIVVLGPLMVCLYGFTSLPSFFVKRPDVKMGSSSVVERISLDLICRQCPMWTAVSLMYRLCTLAVHQTALHLRECNSTLNWNKDYYVNNCVFLVTTLPSTQTIWQLLISVPIRFKICRTFSIRSCEFELNVHLKCLLKDGAFFGESCPDKSQLKNSGIGNMPRKIAQLLHWSEWCKLQNICTRWSLHWTSWCSPHGQSSTFRKSEHPLTIDWSWKSLWWHHIIKSLPAHQGRATFK